MVNLKSKKDEEKEIQINEDLIIEKEYGGEIQINLFEEYTHINIEQAKSIVEFLNKQIKENEQ